ncbi:MAG: tetratricopeptide repeat protein [Ruminococcus sp.]|nr:tetratricopeptide repeat protein [Ruminococcus sp.]
MTDYVIPQNEISLNGSNNCLSGINQGGQQQNLTILMQSPRAPLDTIITSDAAWSLNRDYFLERDDEIKEVTEIIEDDSSIKLQIQGIGGFGKTSLCCQLFKKYLKNPPESIKHIGWIPYKNDLKSSIFKKIKSVDYTLNDPELYLQQAKNLFNSLGSSLVLFIDNADDITDEDVNFLRSCTCRVILTARYRIEQIEEYILPQFPAEVCMNLYRKLSRDKKEENETYINEILEIAGYHTQTICLLARTQKECGFTAEELLSELKNNGFSLKGISDQISFSKPEESFEATFFEHMKKLFDIAKIKNQQQLRTLKLFSLLAPNQPLQRINAKDWLGRNQIKELIKRGWLNECENGDVYIHPVIAQTVRCSNPTDLNTALKLIYHLKKALDNSSGKGIDIQNKLMPHVVSVAEFFSEEKSLDLVPFYASTGIIYSELAVYNNALNFFEKNRIICEKNLGTEHPDTALTYNYIGNIYGCTCDYNKALEYHNKALAIYEKEFGIEHFNTATVYNNIGVTYMDTGDYAKALEYHNKALEICEKASKMEDTFTALVYNNVGFTYGTMGDYPKALENHNKALEIREKKLGTKHPITASTYNNIGITYGFMDDYSKALEYYNKALAINESVLGMEHPDIATTYYNLGFVFKMTAQPDDALIYAEKALEIFKNKFTEHDNTARTYNLLADIYLLKEDYPNAMCYAKTAKEIYEKINFNEHPYSAENFRTLAEISLADGQLEKAVEYAEKSQHILESKFNEKHPDTIKTYRVLADIYEKLNDTQKAADYRKKSE